MIRIGVLISALTLALAAGQAIADHKTGHAVPGSGKDPGANESRASAGIENECELNITNGSLRVTSTIENKSSGGGDILVTLKEVTAQYKPSKAGGVSGVRGNELVPITTQGCDYEGVDWDDCFPDKNPTTIVIAAGEMATHTEEFSLCVDGSLITPDDPNNTGLMTARALNALVYRLVYYDLEILQERDAQGSQCVTSRATDGSTELVFEGGLPMKPVLDYFGLMSLGGICN